MHTKPACLITRGRHDPARSRATNSDRNPAQRRIVALFHGRVESVHIDVDDTAKTGRQIGRVRHVLVATVPQGYRCKNETGSVAVSLATKWSAVMLPPNDELNICFAHVACRLHERFSALATGINSFEVRDPETLESRVGEAEVLVISGLWQDGLLDRAQKLRFIQAIGAGTDQFPREELAKRSIRLASARGVNYRAVAEHAMALILALSRRLPEARDNQAQRVWRGMIGDLAQREDELGGKTLLVVGLGQIGGRLAQLAKAFDMRVDGLRRDPAAGRGAADAVHTMSELKSLLPAADFVVLTCPLTKETENLIDAEALDRMKRSAYLVNVARGRIADEVALAEALAERRIAGAAVDVTTEEPLAANSPLWGMEHVLIPLIQQARPAVTKTM
jgi:phosphoglycerate dehydrogenase-like enzyme